MNTITSREVRLLMRPVGMPSEQNFEIAEVSIPEPTAGELLVQNIYLSVDPYMRGRMRDQESYLPPFQPGEPLEGGCVGKVVKSNHDEFEEGRYVLSNQGWREYYVSDGNDLISINPEHAPLQCYLGILGMPGLTAYVGLLDIGCPKKGETVFVSGAAGAVGSVVCQIAKIKGCRVVGSVGSGSKAKWLQEEGGVDRFIDYNRTDNLVEELNKHCPDGIDIYFDNVGGDHLQAALEHMNPNGRVVLCGMISQYNVTEPPPGPNNLFQVIVKQLSMKGFLVMDHEHRKSDLNKDMIRWLKEGRIKWTDTILEGIERMPEAFIGLFRGENIGKMLVKVGPDPEE